jgi:prolyl oligopeptidase
MDSAKFVRVAGATYVFVTWITSAVDTRVSMYHMEEAAETRGACKLTLAVHSLLPTVSKGVAVSLSAWCEEPIVRVSVSGLYIPRTLYGFDVRDQTMTILHEKVVPGVLPPSDFETEVLYAGDAGDVPVLVFGRRLEGNPLCAPTRTRRMILYGYGGFRHSMAPITCNTTMMVVLQDQDAPLYAVACIRGGEERGATWAEEGCLRQKHRCFDDFRAASDAVVGAGLTGRSQLALMGGSNGGLLVLACITKWPEMAGAVWANVPLTDMLRFHLVGGGKA